MKTEERKLRCVNCEYATNFRYDTYNGGTELTVLCERQDKRVCGFNEDEVCTDFREREKAK